MVRDTPGPVTIVRVEDKSEQRQLHPSDTLGAHLQWGTFDVRTDAREVPLSPCRGCGGLMAGSNFNGRWREHPGCAGDHSARVIEAASILRLGTVEPIVAAGCSGVVARYADVHREPTWKKGETPQDRWAHVNRRALQQALQDARAYLADAQTPGPCTLGACWLCGRLDDLAWADYGHTWPNGSGAPLCSVCAPIHDRRGADPRKPDRTRAVVAEAMTGVPLMMGEAEHLPAGLIAFGLSDQSSSGEPWSHMPAEAVEKFKWTRWLQFGGKYAPAEHREEVQHRLAEQDRQQAEQERQRAEAERTPDVFGFGS